MLSHRKQAELLAVAVILVGPPVLPALTSGGTPPMLAGAHFLSFICQPTKLSEV